MPKPKPNPPRSARQKASATMGVESIYLAKSVGLPLIQCLAELTTAHPKDPIEWISHWLYRYSDNEIYFYEKAIFLQDLYRIKVELNRDNEVRQSRIDDCNDEIKRLKRLVHEYRQSQHFCMESYLKREELELQRRRTQIIMDQERIERERREQERSQSQRERERERERKKRTPRQGQVKVRGTFSDDLTTDSDAGYVMTRTSLIRWVDEVSSILDSDDLDGIPSSSRRQRKKQAPQLQKRQPPKKKSISKQHASPEDSLGTPPDSLDTPPDSLGTPPDGLVTPPDHTLSSASSTSEYTYSQGKTVSTFLKQYKSPDGKRGRPIILPETWSHSSSSISGQELEKVLETLQEYSIPLPENLDKEFLLNHPAQLKEFIHILNMTGEASWGLDPRCALVCRHSVLGTLQPRRPYVPPETPAWWAKRGYLERTLYDHEIYSTDVATGNSLDSVFAKVIPPIKFAQYFPGEKKVQIPQEQAQPAQQTPPEQAQPAQQTTPEQARPAPRPAPRPPPSKKQGKGK